MKSYGGSSYVILKGMTELIINGLEVLYSY